MSDSEQAVSQINLDLDRVFEPVSTSIRRSYVFCGLGVNAAEDPKLQEFHLTGRGRLSFVPQTASEADLQIYKQEFATWVVAGALRDLIEAFSISLDRAFELCLTVEWARGKAEVPPEKRLGGFLRKGLSGKFKALQEDFGVSSNLVDGFHSFNLLRNCISHRRGFVGEEDCNEGDKLVVKYHQIELFVRSESGNETIVPLVFKEPFLIRDGGQFCMRVIEGGKAFPSGSLNRILPEDVTHLIWTVWSAGFAVKNSLVSYCVENGVRVENK